MENIDEYKNFDNKTLYQTLFKIKDEYDKGKKDIINMTFKLDELENTYNKLYAELGRRNLIENK